MRFRLTVLFLFPALLSAQQNINVSVSNYLRYGTGTETVNSFSRKRDYFENLTETRITVSDFLIGFRLLYDSPPEYGMEFTGLKKRYAEFRKDDVTVRAGDSYSLYGRGMALNLFERRGLAFDTGLDGIKMGYNTRFVKTNLTAGNIKYSDVLSPSRVEEYKIRAGSVELVPYPSLGLGVNFVSGELFVPTTFVFLEPARFDMPEFFGHVQLDEVDIFASYAEKRTREKRSTFMGNTDIGHRGTGFYASGAYTAESFGVSIEYKDYRFGIADPYNRIEPNRATKALAFQNPPIVHKEHSFTLLSRYPHIIDFGDEVGYQVDLFYTVCSRFTGSVNAAAASRHYSFVFSGDTSSGPVRLPLFRAVPRKSSFLPDFSARFSPFWEFYTDLQYYFEEGVNDYALIGFNRRSNVTVDELSVAPSGEASTDVMRTTAIPVALQYSFPEGWVVKFDSESQWVYEKKNPSQPYYHNQLLSLSVSRSPEYSVTLRYEFTNDYGTVDGHRNWTAIDFGFRLSTSHNITLTAGGDRGGQICANGVCRVVNPFLGVRASIMSYL